jgi:hypothetical protein
MIALWQWHHLPAYNFQNHHLPLKNQYEPRQKLIPPNPSSPEITTQTVRRRISDNLCSIFHDCLQSGIIDMCH